MLHLLQYELSAEGDVFLYPDISEMSLHTNIRQISLEFDVDGSAYALCNFVVQGCASELSVIRIIKIIPCTIPDEY